MFNVNIRQTNADTQHWGDTRHMLSASHILYDALLTSIANLSEHLLWFKFCELIESV